MGGGLFYDLFGLINIDLNLCLLKFQCLDLS
jgi:hypothetical protein